ncbi:DUF2267 domain-containing protein [Natronorubrum daqingense]|uniref:Uncharacterized conserved protein, DUF2267 family n=1 Tax=Natronorubrum daqingense TaxID=588898 RepID=A0A1N7F333_9EURY|nr:DUF2267 domain-containing protein [Natronorubrum daqingense]APX97499.1 hypothetical protein BB347_13275 [Natronorubrum daqingense]SIR94699.1 Uncharacterized conserved protein, DUF2267 family [Natronorubrum daqingense]
MEQAAIVETVSDRTEADEDGAMDATSAVLQTLGERLSEDQSRDLAAELPADLSEHLTTGESGQRFSEEEFVSRVDQRMETHDVTGERAATAVMASLLEEVDGRERDAVVDQFEHYGFETLLGETDADIDVSERSPRER